MQKTKANGSQGELAHVRAEILSNLRIMNSENNIVEVRILNTAKGTVSGYFDDMEELCEEILPYNGVYNIFATLNPCSSELAAIMNKLQTYAKDTTKDHNIAKRDWLLIDIDPKRPSNTSSTDDELISTFEAAILIQDFLTENGFPLPVTAMSGNGMHLLYKISVSNNSESNALIKAFLNALAAEFSNEKIDVDKSVYNAARICKLYGTMAVKGENTEERPHRQSCIADVPESIEIVSAEQIEAVTALLAPPQAQNDVPAKSHGTDTGNVSKKFDVEAFISENNLDVAAVKEEADHRLWRIACPFKEHEDKAAFIQQFHNGAISAGCHHAKCEWGWKELRAKFDKKYAERQELRREAAEAQQPEHLVPYNDLLTAERQDMYIDSGGNMFVFQGGKTNPHWAKLSNFVPVPLEVVHEIDGVGNDRKRTSIKIGGWLEGTKELNPLVVDVEKLFRGRWVMDFDIKAAIYSNAHGGCDKVREVIQLFTENAVETTIYEHLGFRTIDGKLCYLHAGGAIGRDNVSVNLAQNNLSGYVLEDMRRFPTKHKVKCIVNTLKVFDIHRYGNVLFAYSVLAPLCEFFKEKPAFSMWLYGKSDTQKSTVAALLLNFFGKGFSKSTFPISFTDTEYTKTKKLSLCKDVLAVIDDVLHPTAKYGDMKILMREAQNMIFNIANRSGRGRMRGDESLKKTHIPSGMVIFTAENPFDSIGESTTARLLCLEFEKGSVNLNALTECQKNAFSFNRTMSCFVEWLIANAETLAEELQLKFEELRAGMMASTKPNTSKKLIEVCAFMHLSMECALQCFIEMGTVDDEFKNEALSRLDADLQVLIEKQSAAIVTSSPTKQFIDVIGNLFADGTIFTKHKNETASAEQKSGKNLVGWHDRINYYFRVGENTSNLYVAVKQYYRQHDQTFDIQPKELFRRLVDEGIVTETDKGTNRYSKSVRVDGKSERVLVIPKSVFHGGESAAEDLDDNPFDDDDPLQ